LFRYAVFKEQGTAPGARLSQGCTDATLARERLRAMVGAALRSPAAHRGPILSKLNSASLCNANAGCGAHPWPGGAGRAPQRD